jgi:hypothetical protein
MKMLIIERNITSMSGLGMEKEQAKALWICQVISALKEDFDVSTDEFLALDLKHNIVGWLYANYEILHYDAQHLAAEEVLQRVNEGSNLLCTPN